MESSETKLPAQKDEPNSNVDPANRETAAQKTSAEDLTATSKTQSKSESQSQNDDDTAPPPAASAERAPAVATPPPGETPSQQDPELVRAAYEHPFIVRLTHWVNAISLFVMITSGLRIFRAFPSFGPKIPEKILIDIPRQITLGGWLGGALQWHFTFMWFFAGSGIVYLAYQILSGHYKIVVFTRKDIPGVWPMARHYFLFGPKPASTGQYNALQKLAYTSTIALGVLSLLTGIVLYKPVQFSWLAFLFGGFHLTRIWHFAAMCGFLAFIPGHLIMVALHGWSNFFSMLSGWKPEPEYQE